MFLLMALLALTRCATGLMLELEPPLLEDAAREPLFCLTSAPSLPPSMKLLDLTLATAKFYRFFVL